MLAAAAVLARASEHPLVRRGTLALVEEDS